VVVAKIVKEESDVVLGEARGNAERQETGRDNPPAVERFLHGERLLLAGK
jgi:hypothetical protein